VAAHLTLDAHHSSSVGAIYAIATSSDAVLQFKSLISCTFGALILTFPHALCTTLIAAFALIIGYECTSLVGADIKDLEATRVETRSITLIHS
jgi:hypothetical protein